jgi:hypothetical protein
LGTKKESIPSAAVIGFDANQARSVCFCESETLTRSSPDSMRSNASIHEQKRPVGLFFVFEGLVLGFVLSKMPGLFAGFGRSQRPFRRFVLVILRFQVTGVWNEANKSIDYRTKVAGRFVFAKTRFWVWSLDCEITGDCVS